LEEVERYALFGKLRDSGYEILFIGRDRYGCAFEEWSIPSLKWQKVIPLGTEIKYLQDYLEYHPEPIFYRPRLHHNGYS